MPEPVTDWNAFPNRPTHPDFAVLADLILAGDAAAEEGHMLAYWERWTGLSEAQVSQAALHEGTSVAQSTAAQHGSTYTAMVTAWQVGFFAGLRVSRGVAWPSASELTESWYERTFGIDMVSVRYVAGQRTRLLARGAGVDLKASPQANLPAVASTWVDAMVVGRRFDARNREIHGDPQT